MSNYIIILFVAMSCFLSASGQLMWKLAAGGLDSYKIFVGYFVPGLLLYLVSLLAWIMLLAYADLSFLHPFSSLRYIFALALAKIFLKENVDEKRITAVTLIIIGLIIISI